MVNLNPGGAVGVVMMATTVGRVPRRGWLTGHHWFASGSVGLRPRRARCRPSRIWLIESES
jgi:hypothetical protein